MTHRLPLDQARRVRDIPEEGGRRHQDRAVPLEPGSAASPAWGSAPSPPAALTELRAGLVPAFPAMLRPRQRAVAG